MPGAAYRNGVICLLPRRTALFSTLYTHDTPPKHVQVLNTRLQHTCNFDPKWDVSEKVDSILEP
jgi:hypothetical protein